MTQFDITAISDEDLCDAGRRLQAAHDYIEVHSFDIGTYGAKGCACCYIGSVKVVNSLNTEPEPRQSLANATAAALDVLDDVAREAFPEALDGLDGDTKAYHEDCFKSREGEMGEVPGRLVESLGFATCGRAGGKQEQAEIALPVFRQAIREVVNEMERRESLVASWGRRMRFSRRLGR